MNSNVKKLMMAAAVTGLISGTSALVEAAPVNSSAPSAIKAAVKAGKISMANGSNFAADKHSCKGKNDCKGQGGCKTSDNGCKGKNSCKGKGGCATDGSKAV